jgi:hypothetical protein
MLTQIVNKFPMSPKHATCLHIILLDLIAILIYIEKCMVRSSKCHTFLKNSVTGFLLGLNTFLSTLFSVTFSQHYCFNVRRQDSHSQINTNTELASVSNFVLNITCQLAAYRRGILFLGLYRKGICNFAIKAGPLLRPSCVCEKHGVSENGVNQKLCSRKI